MNETIPTLPPATGARRVLATEGNGRLESNDDTRYNLAELLKGPPADEEPKPEPAPK